MNADEFGKLKGALAKLTLNQRRQLKDQIQAAEQQQAVHVVLGRLEKPHPARVFGKMVGR